MKAVVCLPNWIGDAVMATPTLQALRQLLPDGHITLVARPYIAPLFEPWPHADALLRWGSAAAGGRGLWRLAGRLRRERADVGLALPNSFKSALLLWLAGARRRIGYARDGRSILLTDRHQAPTQDGDYIPTPQLTYYFDLVRPLGDVADAPPMRLYTTGEDERAADALYTALGLDGERTLIMAPGAAFGLAKCWPPERFSAIASRAAEELGLRTLVLCAPKEAPVGRAIADGAGGSAVMAPEPLPDLRTAKALVRRARAMVTNDSGLRHFAAAYDIPVVTIFGPTHINWTETWFAKETKLQAAVPCGPCQKRLCPEGHLQCMDRVTPEMVFDALSAAVERFPYQQPSEASIIAGP